MRRFLYEFEKDCRSTTGRNIRKLLVANNVINIQDIDTKLIPYYTIPEGNEWKIELVNEIVNVKAGIANVNNFTVEELNDICEFVCSS